MIHEVLISFYLCLNKTLAIIKLIPVTQLSDAGEMETVTDIKKDLTKLQRLNVYFGVSEIKEVNLDIPLEWSSYTKMEIQ